MEVNTDRRATKYTPEIAARCSGAVAEEQEFARKHVFTFELIREDLLSKAWTMVDNARSGCLEKIRGGLGGHARRPPRARTRPPEDKIRLWVADQAARQSSSSTSSP